MYVLCGRVSNRVQYFMKRKEVGKGCNTETDPSRGDKGGDRRQGLVS